MSTELEVRQPGGALAIGSGQTSWTEQQLAVLRSAGVNQDVSQAELDAFLHECQRTKLDPFSKQIYLIGRYDGQAGRKVFRSQTGIDGYRVVAHRVAREDRSELEYEDTLWCGPDGNWRDVWLSATPPAAAKVTVLKGGKRYSAVATLEEYAARYPDGNPYPMWRRMPANQLEKCAEAKALRRAFPNDLAGIYTAEEMEHADAEAYQPAPVGAHPADAAVAAAGQDHFVKPSQASQGQWETPAAAEAPIEDAQIVEESAPKPSSPAQRRALVIALEKKLGITEDAERYEWLSEGLKRPITSSKQLTYQEALDALHFLANVKDPATPDPEDHLAGLRDGIEGASNMDELNSAGRLVAAAVQAGAISQDQANSLDPVWRARGAELQAEVPAGVAA